MRCVTYAAQMSMWRCYTRNQSRNSVRALRGLEQSNLENINKCFNINIYSYLETSGGKSCILYLNVVHFFNAIVN
jgi:hypothetical protein